MKQMLSISQIIIRNLYGEISYKLQLENNTLVLVAENGSGKTTIVNMIYYFLSKQWSRLIEFDFESIVIIVSEKQYIFDKTEFRNPIFDNNLLQSEIPERYIRSLQLLSEKIDINEIRHFPAHIYEDIAFQYDIPLEVLERFFMIYKRKSFDISKKSFDISKNEKIRKIEEGITNILGDTQIVYLPTYRRIEKDLKNIFPDLEKDMKEYEYRRQRKFRFETQQKDYIELVEFGMEDVKSKVQQRCQELRSNFYSRLSKDLTGSYLEDILNDKYKKFEAEKVQGFDTSALETILKRLDDSILSNEGKNSLRKFVTQVKESGASNTEDKIKAYFVWKIFQIYENQQRLEQDINAFVKICNDYIKKRKEFVYDSDNFEVKIKLLKSNRVKNEINELDFKDLSSGEKQIVSLFSHLYLSKRNYFIIIDEPELSLSVPWQEKFLVDIFKSEKCVGILAVTHSPFIYKNELKKYSHSLEEFAQQ